MSWTTLAMMMRLMMMSMGRPPDKTHGECDDDEVDNANNDDGR